MSPPFFTGNNMQFIDEAKIFIKSGNGGSGCVSFRREANIPRGGPDGGNGGRGGSIILESIAGLNTLIDFRYQQHFLAKKGENGKGANRYGKSADDIIIKVPVGTQVFLEDKESMVVDFTEVGQTMVIAKGGDGGFGNVNFKSSTNQAPRKATAGWPGEEMWLWIKLKLLSDAGIIGLPNAGKSTFLSRVTSAKPKIADYPFTTLKPQLGVVYSDEKEFVIADIPGLIEGAHEGHGLGHRFLRHIERCGVILHLVDATESNIKGNYKTIRNELSRYSSKLSEKKEIIALNKCDSVPEEELTKKKKELEKASKNEVFVISSVTGAGVAEVLRKLQSRIDEFKGETAQESKIERKAV